MLQGQQVAGAIETVLIPVTREGSLRPRTTLCVSSQVGCAMNCQFCFTGRMGLRYALADRLKSSNPSESAADCLLGSLVTYQVSTFDQVYHVTWLLSC